MGSTTVNVDIEVRDYFKLTQTSTAPSFKLHRFGDYQNMKLVWNGMQVSGVSESDVRSSYKDLNFGRDYVLEEVK